MEDKIFSYLSSAEFQERVRAAARRPQPFVTISRQAGAGGLTVAEGEKKLDELEASRRRLVERWFHRDADDPLLYDAVINVESAGCRAAAALAAELVARRTAALAELAGAG